MCVCLCAHSCLTLCDHMDCSPPGSCVHGMSQAKNTGAGSQSLLQGIFPTQALNQGRLRSGRVLDYLFLLGQKTGHLQRHQRWETKKERQNKSFEGHSMHSTEFWSGEKQPHGAALGTNVRADELCCALLIIILRVNMYFKNGSLLNNFSAQWNEWSTKSFWKKILQAEKCMIWYNFSAESL